MTSKFLRALLATAVTLTFPAFAQTGSGAAPTSPATTTANPPAATPAPAMVNTGTRIGAINIEAAIFNTNEGLRDMQTLQKKYEPKQAELKNQNDELEALKKQLETQGPKLNDDAAATLKKQIESKQKLFDRAVQDAQEEFGSQQQEIAGRILQKMAPMIAKYAQENGYGMLLDTSKQWPQSPVLLAGEGVDITKPVVDIYNAQSGVAAPTPSGAGAKPPAPKPTAAGTTAAKPTTPKTGETPK